mgnify:CR=1 FL=1
MMNRKPFYRQALHYFFLGMIALLFAAIFHFCISPVMTQETEFDVSCFHVIGNAMRFGNMPYLNFIDNKGPVQYVIYLLASLIGPFPWGVFIISTLLDFCMLVMLEQICRRLKIPHAFWILPLFLFFYTCVCSNGGLTEDFSLPLTMAAFLIYLDFDERFRQREMRLLTGFLLGLLFWLCAFTRINNALPIGLITASIGVQLLVKKEWKKTAAYIGSFATGTLLIVVPIVLWLLQKGAWQEFLNQFLINNFKYAAAEDAISKVDLFFHNRFGFALFFLVIESILGAYLFYRRSGKARGSILITTLVVLLGTGLSFISMTQSFPHYLLVILIPAFFGFVLQYAYPDDAPEKNKKRRLFVIFTTVFCCVGMIFTFSGKVKVEDGLYYVKTVSHRILDGELFQETEYEQTIDRLADRIPLEEQNSVYSLNADPRFYAYSGIIPCKRMFVCQALFTDISKEYADEFVSYFAIDPPKWLVTEEPLETIDLCGTGAAITAAYRLVDDTTGYYYLYERR